MDSMDHVKALEELDGHKIKKYNVWKVHLSEEKEERGYLCKWSYHNFKNSQKKTTKQVPYLIKVDPFDDRFDSSSKVNLCLPSVGTCSLNEGTLSCDESDATLVDPIDVQVDSSRKINLCPPSVGINDLNESLDHSTISCFTHVNFEVECLLKDNLLFDDDMTLEIVHSEMPYNVGSVVTLSGYQLFENPLWCDDTLSKDGNLFYEDDSTFIGEVSVKMKWDAYVLNVTSSLCVPILHMNCASLVYKVEAKLGNNLIEVHLCDTFLYYLFAYDDVSTFEWSTMIMEYKGANRVNKGVLDPCSWISFPFDPGNELNCGISLVMLGQDDKNNLEEFVGAFPYDGKFFLRVYNLLEGPTLCMGKGSFLTPFLYYLFAYDLVDCTSYGDKSYLSREGEVYLKFVMLSLCVPSCHVMSARILKPSFNLAYRNTLDDPYVHDTFLYYLFAYDESHICLKWALHFGRGLDSRTNPFQEGEDDNKWITWIGRFVEGFSSITSPLTKLTQKKLKFQWLDECEKTFSELKTRLITAPVLTLQDGYVIYCDASRVGLGCVLRQRDHKSLQYMFTHKELNLRQRRWLEFLMDYDMNVLYYPGKTNVHRLRNKEVTSVTNLWRSQSVEGATWEADAVMMANYPYVFPYDSISASSNSSSPVSMFIRV
ncbi:hypothetical protein MTR67_007634 [Solanum verrucosum]|uniref:Reverse transcriptase/retrotransposon-derived protein RNase H-like domain-containing protein n=1 Tax=Solanum verrucosum TaxID=315347 RepID=A0AAF0Q002_SOLVR|nr:hypothetical protein MTR67_007634 [Solanum verrucosum]